jgi:hypothetical protein
MHYKNACHRLFIAWDQLLNTALGGDPDETLSARAWRREQQVAGAWRILRRGIDAAFFWQNEHCKAAFRAEMRSKRRYLQQNQGQAEKAGV